MTEMLDPKSPPIFPIPEMHPNPAERLKALIPSIAIFTATYFPLSSPFPLLPDSDTPPTSYTPSTKPH